MSGCQQRMSAYIEIQETLTTAFDCTTEETFSYCCTLLLTKLNQQVLPSTVAFKNCSQEI